jgi:hypothetical protein
LELQHALKDSVDCIQAYSKKGWLRKLAAPGGDTRTFQDLYQRITHEMELLQFDLAMTPPQWRDESKALRARVLESTGRTVEEGGLELLLKTPGAAEDLHSILGCDAQVLAAELARAKPGTPFASLLPWNLAPTRHQPFFASAWPQP